MPHEAEIQRQVDTLLSEGGGGLPARDVAHCLMTTRNMSEQQARRALWVLLEQGFLRLGDGMRLTR